MLFALLLLLTTTTTTTTSTTTTSFPTTTFDLSSARHQEHLIRVALGVDNFRHGSFPSILDESLFPRPHRLRRPSPSVASRHHIQYPSNVHVARTSGDVYISSFQSNQVYRIRAAADGEPEIFARGTYCNSFEPCITLSGPWVRFVVVVVSSVLSYMFLYSFFNLFFLDPDAVIVFSFSLSLSLSFVCLGTCFKHEKR